jgi:hypothetical protein
MDKKPRPTLNDFFERKVGLAKALDALTRWENLTDAELEELGFTS